MKPLYVPLAILTNFSNDGLYTRLLPKDAEVIGIESKISDGTVTRFETKEHSMTNELTVVPIGVSVDRND